MSISSIIKSIQDIMRKDVGLDGDALNQLGPKERVDCIVANPRFGCMRAD